MEDQYTSSTLYWQITDIFLHTDLKFFFYSYWQINCTCIPFIFPICAVLVKPKGKKINNLEHHGVSCAAIPNLIGIPLCWICGQSPQKKVFKLNLSGDFCKSHCILGIPIMFSHCDRLLTAMCYMYLVPDIVSM